ncbi:MAG TPA: hypothetical protein VFW31_14340 [Candidatus Angelobacter sp.]|nr:hypothetical protein [Candidatus Angelobacter sp.]
MSHSAFLIVAMVAVLVGLAFRILSLGSGAARFRLLPPKWQKWFLNGHSSPAARK